ncbi:hypothetical protein RMATCC62417_15239 [Rhizopus microsporus]|nr:hypothetical protein RMATCC62417_15239 [Rhizopus microsporus]
MKALIILLCLHSVIAYQTIIDVLSKDERFEKLVSHLQKLELVPMMNELESGTFFAPVNAAFEKIPDTAVSRESLLYHVLKGKGISSTDFYHGQLKETLYDGYLGSDAQRIKMTVKGHKVYVNQAKLIETDIQVNNYTYIHAIDSVLELPKLLGDSIRDINPALDELMQKADIIQLLKEKTPFTIFVSTKKEPLGYYNDIELTYLMSKHGKTDLSLFLKYAIIDKAIYLDEFTSGKTTYKSITGDSLTITSTKKGEASVNDLAIAQSDILAANGVIHQIDDIFKPNSLIFNTRKYLYGLNATNMVQLFDNYNLSHYIDQTDTNYTFLIPPEDDIPLPPLPAAYWLEYHVIQGLWSQDTLVDKKLLLTEFKSAELGGKRQRMPVYTENDGKKKPSILFDHARSLGDPVSIQNSIIYKISEPLTLPGDFLSRLVVDLESSTFIATLYVSEVVEEIKSTPGITLFAPTNDAFKELGLVAKYLVHFSAKPQLQSVLRYHAAKKLLYEEDMKSKTHEVSTLANSTLRISPDDQTIHVGRPDDSSTAAIVNKPNILVSNGVIHKISKVQIPSDVHITNQQVLVGIEANTLMTILEKAELLNLTQQDNTVILAPTDKAFTRLDVQALLEDPYQLERIAKMHMIPATWQDEWTSHESSTVTKLKKLLSFEYPTLLSLADRVIVQQTEKEEWMVQVKDSNQQAQILGFGRTSANGGIILIDNVLMPVRRGIFGLPFLWSLFVILLMITLIGGTISVCGFFGYKVYNRRRLGYRPIF